MPVVDDTLDQKLTEALNDMEHTVQSFKESMAFSAPELYDYYYAILQHKLADIIIELYEKEDENG
jgi:hypothetical protein